MDIFAFTTALLTFIAAVLSVWNAILKKENNRLHNYFVKFQQDYSSHHTQLINIKKGETKREYSTKQLLNENFPTMIHYLFYFIALIIGWIAGSQFDVVEVIVNLFKSEVIFYNPQFWIVTIVLMILLYIPIKEKKIIINRFPYEYMEKTLKSDSQ